MWDIKNIADNEEAKNGFYKMILKFINEPSVKDRIEDYESFLAGTINNYLSFALLEILARYSEKVGEIGWNRLKLLVEQIQKNERCFDKKLNKYIQLEHQWEADFDLDKWFNSITFEGIYLLTAIYEASGHKVGIWVNIDSVRKSVCVKELGLANNLEKNIEQLAEAKLVQVEYAGDSQLKIGLTQAALIFVEDEIELSE